MTAHREREERPRLLVLRALGLGDLLAGVPALRGLRRAFPGHELVLAAPEALREAVRHTGAVDALLPAGAPERAVPSLRHWPGPAPQVAVDLHGNGPASRRALEELRPRRLLAFAGPHRPGEPAPQWRADEHERTRWCRFLAAHGIPADPADLRLPRPGPSPAPGAVVVHPGANAAARRWPVRRYAAVVRALAGRRVVISGGPGDEPVTAALAAAAGVAHRDVHQSPPFARFAALIAHADLLISADTGPAHLAAAYGTPSVTLFGPVSPALWGPPQDGPHRALYHPGPAGDPHGRSPDPRLLEITPEEVLAAAHGLRRGAGAPGSAGPPQRGTDDDWRNGGGRVRSAPPPGAGASA
ncbi:glycosyltransferase family 9 protein [Actinacidiphila sp. DG2A-62]|uniref:glycosyltransferase family 9 protein n=1 Tax=Actinacidiphila sp. DG2A-62 TaxID=3108821 RepID=UPI002DB6DAF9|nr:glycosyltransferase family 9 protein [Actinacidiphila sp. DG2A-62]MEC3998437.1 glycosyltransferase family 9 protein [Actinacidiphila sp. DG2A-62]